MIIKNIAPRQIEFPSPNNKLKSNNLIKKVDNFQFTYINRFYFIEIEHKQ